MSPDKLEDLSDTRSSEGIQGVCFDGFGTVVEITDKRRPFQALIDREHSTSFGSRAMTHPIGLRELSREVSIPPPEARLAELEADLQAELNSIRLRPGMDLAWNAVHRAGLKIGVCSNLAAPYEQPLMERLPGKPDALVLSFRVKLIKPQPEIYGLVCGQLGLLPSQVLFVGDTLEADVIGPSTIGAFAVPVSEFEQSFAGGASIYAPHLVAQVFNRIVAAKTG